MAAVKFWQGMQEATSVDVLDKTMIGVNADGSTKYANIQRIIQLAQVSGGTGIKGTAEASTDPGTPVGPEMYYAKLGSGDSTTFTNFLDSNGDPIVIPSKEGTAPDEQIVINPILIYDGTSWDADWALSDPINLSGYATKDEVLNNDQLIKIRGFKTDINLFDKNNDVIVGYQLNSSGGADLVSAQASVTDFIYIGEKGRVFIRKGPNGAGRVSWYASNTIDSFVSSTTDTPASPGGEILDRPISARYIRANIDSSSATRQESIDALMISVGESLPAYKPYTVFPDIESQYIGMVRPDSYFKAVTGVPGDSAMNKFTEVSTDFVGRWQVRTENGTTSSKTDDYITLTNDGTGTNAGLIWPYFFNANEIGMRIWYEFEARLVSGDSQWAVYSNKITGDRKNIDIAPGWNKYYIEDTVGSQYADRCLLFAQPAAAASVIDVRDFRVYFTNPNTVSPQASVINELNHSAMANYRYKKAALLNGDNTLLILGLQGDSWTDHVPGAIFYARDLSRLLRALLGNGGGGFYDFSQGSGSSSGQKMASIDPLDANDTRTGTITYKDQTADAKGVNFAHAEFANGSTLTLNVLTAHTGLEVHYYGGGSYGTFRYRIDGGSWNTVNTSSNPGYQTIPNAVSDSAHTVEFEVTSGTCVILGVDMQRTNGIRVHKLGNRGLRTYQVRDVDGENWKDAISAFNLDAMTILLGTNDRTDDRTPTQFKGDLEYFIGLYKAANPYGDLCLISPSNNRNNEPYDMQLYSDKMVEIARDGGYAYTSLIPLFGSSAQIIAKGTFYDGVHPTDTGGKMIAEHLFNNVL